MRKYIFLIIFGIAQTVSAQQPAENPDVTALLEAIETTNDVIIKCVYNPECMLEQYSSLEANESNPLKKRVYKVNLDNLTENQSILGNFVKNCSTEWFNEMNLAEIDCLSKINKDLQQQVPVRQMRDKKLACMQENLNPLVDKGNLFAIRKLANLYGQYNKLDDRDNMEIRFQELQGQSSAQKYEECQAIYSKIKVQYR